jgi:hypothetical protein
MEKRSKKQEEFMRRYSFAGVLFLFLIVTGLAGAADSGRWERLGSREVDFRGDHDRIEVGRAEGRFRQLQIRVKDAPIEISDMVVTFGNNEKFKVAVRHRFDQGTGIRVIDLPGERRAIKSIDFNYRSINRREGKGVVEVYAR